jgi:hypothetical protein
MTFNAETYSVVVPTYLQLAGATWWHSADRNSPNLSKASLGEFFYHAMKIGAHIGYIWPFAPEYDRCLVKVSVYMTEDMKVKFEPQTKFRFETPPKVHVN